MLMCRLFVFNWKKMIRVFNGCIGRLVVLYVIICMWKISIFSMSCGCGRLRRIVVILWNGGSV